MRTETAGKRSLICFMPAGVSYWVRVLRTKLITYGQLDLMIVFYRFGSTSRWLKLFTSSCRASPVDIGNVKECLTLSEVCFRFPSRYRLHLLKES